MGRASNTCCGGLQEPADYPDRRGALIRDFEHYLGILKAVHSGADLQASAKNAGHCMPPGAKGHLGYVLASVGSNQACTPVPLVAVPLVALKPVNSVCGLIADAC